MAVNYDRVNFKNRVVQYPRRYTESTNDGAITHTASPGTVFQEGNLPTEENMNRMDKGIADCAAAINDILQTLQAIQETLSAYNERIADNEESITDIKDVDEQQSDDIESVTQAHSTLAGNVATDETAARNHYNNYSNPHLVTKAQIGLGNVPNVTTNNQMPTYTEASTDANLSSGETMATAFGKLARGLRSLWAHIARRDNPHGVDKVQVGLGNVPNVTTNNQTPTISDAATWSDIPLGNSTNLTTILSKVRAGLAALFAHVNDTDNPHETSLFDVAKQSLISNLGNPDTVGTFVGTGSGQVDTHITVNGYSVIGQSIDLGYTPSVVAIMIPYAADKSSLGMDNNEARAIGISCMIGGPALYGVALIGPGSNYYHDGCGADYRNRPPEDVLMNRHGGAVVYGNGFIVQSYGSRDDDTIMYMNCKDRLYTYLAWR